jgi:hypothetical protein
MQPNGNELWVMLLEKAFAQFCGSYQSLSCGFTTWAMQARSYAIVAVLYLLIYS